MYRIRHDHIQHFLRCYYYVWITVWVVGLFLLAWFFGSLSPSDTYLIRVNMLLAMVEISTILVWLFLASYMSRWLKSNYSHMIYARWVSYAKIYIIYRMLWILCLLYIYSIATIGLSIWIGYLAALLQMWYMILKVVLLYTLAYIVAFYLEQVFVWLLTMAMGFLCYSIILVQSMIEKIDVVIVQWLLIVIVYVTPTFVNNSRNPNHHARLAQNFLHIAIVLKIYIVALLWVWLQCYRFTQKK